jgi:hypothetical protein
MASGFRGAGSLSAAAALCGQSKQAAWRAAKANNARKPQWYRLNAATNDIEGLALKRWVLLTRDAFLLFHFVRFILASVLVKDIGFSANDTFFAAYEYNRVNYTL